jgi:hypothetical protein
MELLRCIPSSLNCSSNCERPNSTGHICIISDNLIAALFQLTFVSDEVLPPELSINFTFGATTYTLYTKSFLNFGQVSISNESTTLYWTVNSVMD